MPTIETKLCSKCKGEFPLTKDYFAQVSPDSTARWLGGWSPQCKACVSAYQKNRYPTLDKEKLYWYNVTRWLKRAYDLTLETYQKMIQSQNGVCKICGEPETARNPRTGRLHNLSVDHDHETGQIRSALCTRCNKVVGMLNEDPDLAYKLLDYLIWCRQLKEQFHADK